MGHAQKLIVEMWSLQHTSSVRSFCPCGTPWTQATPEGVASVPTISPSCKRDSERQGEEEEV